MALQLNIKENIYGHGTGGSNNSIAKTILSNVTNNTSTIANKITNSLLQTSNVQTIIQNNAKLIVNDILISDSLNTLGKNVYIPVDHVLYPGIICINSICSLLGHIPVSVIDINKLNSVGVQVVKNAKLWHTHKINNITYELVYYENTYFYRIQGQSEKLTINPDNKIIDNNIIKNNDVITNNLNEKVNNIEIENKSIITKQTYTYTYTFDKISQVNNEVINKTTINDFIKKDIYQNVTIILNMNKGLCLNKSMCYLKFDFYIDKLNKIYKTIYVKYYSSTGLMSRQLYNFSIDNSTEKNMLQNGFVKITAYQLADFTDVNPYTIGKFKFSDMKSKSKVTTLYRLLEITDVYNFTFDDILIYPTTITGELYKDTTYQYISIHQYAQIINNVTYNDKIYVYVLDYNYIQNNILNKKAISIDIDYNDIWTEYYDFYCNVIFYLKNGKSFILSDLKFNKLNNQLILNVDVSVDKTKFNLNDIVKFSITYLGGKKSNQQIKINNIKLLKQGNIINN